jgi:hypothetical protein
MTRSATRLSAGRSLAFVVLCLIPAALGLGQTPGRDRVLSFPLDSNDEKERWLRVSTESGFAADVDSLSLVIEPDRSITARFRTTFSKAEHLTTRSSAKYKVREDTIQFDTKEARYRIVESDYLDDSGKIVASSADTAWRPIRSGLGSRMFLAASQLRPFGAWNVLSYRYASGEPPSDNDPRELRDLLRTYVIFKPDRFVAGKLTCYTPVLEARTITDEEFRKRIGTPLKSIGLTLEKVDAVFVSCESKDSFPANTMMLRLPDGKIAMLWNGVFLELERIKNSY